MFSGSFTFVRSYIVIHRQNICDSVEHIWEIVKHVAKMFLYRPSDGSTARVNKILQRRTYLIIVLILVLTCTNITYISIYIIYDIIYV